MKARIVLIFFILLFLLSLASDAYANYSYPLMLNLKLKNIPEGAYVDILLSEDWTGGFDSENTDVTAEYNIDSETSPLYNYNEDGFLAVNVRANWCEKFELKKNSLKLYFIDCPPKGFKVIVQTEDGEIKVSEYSDFDAYNNKYQYNYNTNIITKCFLASSTVENLIFYFIILQITLIITIVIEIIVALFFKFPKIPVLWVNAITNPAFNIILIIIYYSSIQIPYYITIIFLELIVILAEFLIYKRVTKFPAKRVLLYTLCANATSLILPFILLLL